MKNCDARECAYYDESELGHCGMYANVINCCKLVSLMKGKVPMSSLSSEGLVGLCGCGEPARYMVGGDEYACNKYMRCLTREELQGTLQKANRIIGKLRKAMKEVAATHKATGTANYLNSILDETAD